MHDVAVIGGGPAGSTVASLLAGSGRDVVLFERDRFPRFHIGESLLPHNMRIFERLGIVDALEQRFIEKWGVEFVSSRGDLSKIYHFDAAIDARYPKCFQVLRSEFDHLLLRGAAQRGARVHEETRVVEARTGGNGHWRITVAQGDGAPREVTARALVDASGRDGFLARQNGLRRMNPLHRRACVFAHYRGVARREGRDAGNIVIIMFSDGWLWLIPLADDMTSIGLVVNGSQLRAQQGDAAELLEHAIDRCRPARERMRSAVRVTDPRTTSDWTYSCRHLAGDGYLIVGDAGEFVDPVFSSGVLLAMSSGEFAADLLDDALRRNDLSRRRFMPFERRVRRHVAGYSRMVDVYYSPAFPRLCLFPERRIGIPEALISILAGDVEPGWPVRWRLELFHWIARILPRLGGDGKVRLDRVFEEGEGREAIPPVSTAGGGR